MAKFPSQRKLHYKLEGIDDQTMTSLGKINLPKDLSILNRRGYASTTRKGVPLIFRCKVDFYLHNYLGHLFDDDGTALASAYDGDMQATLKMRGAQNNWVMKNAAVKWHAALSAMRKSAGIRKSDLGTYAHEIRYNLSTATDSWLSPIDSDTGAAFTGGTWDTTRFTTYADQDFGLKLVGTGTQEETSASLADVQNFAYSYLLSRAQPLADSNEHISETPSDYSILRTMLEGSAFEDTSTRVHDAREDAENQGDNPPYELIDISDGGDQDHDITQSVELGRAVAGMGSAYGSMVVDIPFGLADCLGTIMQHATQTDEPDGFMCVEILDIFEMQG